MWPKIKKLLFLGLELGFNKTIYHIQGHSMYEICATFLRVSWVFHAIFVVFVTSFSYDVNRWF